MSALVMFALLFVTFVSGRSNETWTIGFWVIGALIGCGIIIDLIARWHYRCPRCRKALFEDQGDSDAPLEDPESCPFCGGACGACEMERSVIPNLGRGIRRVNSIRIIRERKQKRRRGRRRNT